MDAKTQQHKDILKRIALVWEAMPEWWGFCQVIQYIHYFRENPDKYNHLSDKEFSELCDRIVAEMDKQRATVFTKLLLIQKMKPNKDTYLEAAKDVLVSEEYDRVLAAIIDPEVYDRLDAGLKAVVDAYFDFQT